MANIEIVVLTGAGISAESGLPTFRDSNGLWKHYRFEDIASPVAWRNHPADVLDFYNMRRRFLADVEPNEAHWAISRLQEVASVQVVTQNVDNLHERAGTKNILHLHGELTKARSSTNPNLITEIGYRDILLGEKAADGSLLRPHIVWFGEEVPFISRAIELVSRAAVFIVIGTSLQVYPAAGLLQYASKSCRIFYVDLKASLNRLPGLTAQYIDGPAATVVPALVSDLINELQQSK